jgi:CRP/FNR family transcriptional regulator, cyclic AMP receptor protein
LLVVEGDPVNLTAVQAPPSPAAPSVAMHTAPLLDADSDLGRGIPTADLDVARRHLRVPALTVPAGPLPPGVAAAASRTPGLLVLDGFVALSTGLCDRGSLQIFGAGDVLLVDAGADRLVPTQQTWHAQTTSTLAVLEERFLAATRRWPSLALRVQERLAAQAGFGACHLALSQLPRVEQRVLAFMWHLAERWGRMSPDGVIVPIALKHSTLGLLVGARRPTVTLALGELSEAGQLRRRADGFWLLAPESRAELAGERRFTRD